MEMRVKHLEKMGEVAKAVVLAKACTECSFISNQATFRQTCVSLLCHLLPNEEAIMEISRLDCKDVLEITCNLETEGEENTAFILCTTFLTQQLQQQSLYCSWELTLLWSKLQRRIDPSLMSLLERCLQLGAIAKTVHHLLYLVRVIQTEAEEMGVPASVELCVKALQLPKHDDSETRISVCKTVSCLLPDDLEVLRACLLTEFLLGPCQEVFGCLEELYLRPDQKYDQENEVIPNSLRCELLLALKAYWPFDPEFWDWKTLKYHCSSLLGLVPESEGEEEEVVVKQEAVNQPVAQEITVKVESEQNRINGSLDSHEQQDTKPSSNLRESQGESETKKHKFSCKICKRTVIDSQIIHHSKRHAKDNCHPCPVCLEKFKSRKDLVPHMKEHIPSETQQNNVNDVQKQTEEDDDIEPGEITIDPSLMLYYKSTHDPDVLHHIVQQAKIVKEKHVDDDEHVTFEYIDQHFKLQNRDEYQCPGTGCTRIFKHSKYLYVHLKSEHKGDENVKHFHQMRDKREKCVFCRRHFVSAYHHRKHRRVHYGDRPYSCVVIASENKESKATMTLVAVCFDGSKFTCGFEKCGMTFSRARDVQRHLKCAHPEHLKLENKEHKHDKERGSKSKGAILAKPPIVLLQKRPPHPPVEVKAEEASAADDQACVESLATAKPYICAMKESQRKHVLRAHYVQVHNLSETLVGKISCASVRYEGNKDPSEQTPQQMVNHGLKVRKKEIPNVQHQHKKKNSENAQNFDNHSPSEEEGEDEPESREEDSEEKGEGEDRTQQVRTTRRLVAKTRELIQRKSARPTATGACTPNGVRKLEYQAEPENTGGQPAPMSLQSIKTDTQDEENHDSLGFPEEEEEDPPPVERNGVLVGADEVLYGEPSTGGHAEDSAAATPNNQKQEERLSLDQIKPLLRPVTVDLSPPCSLRFTTEEGFQDISSTKDGGKILNGSSPTPPVRQPLKRKNELSEQPSNLKDSQPCSPSPRPFDIATYKPIGFESSFLRFIQETTPNDKNNTGPQAHSFPLLKPHAMTGDFTSVQNLKSILDKALAGCGDLAIKQLQYLRPVVVLGRPVCTTTLPDLFPSDTNNSKLLLGS
ncbi:Zinc finger protein Rlf Rearranged L-myc fusion gene protein Zn-15-related protein [Larimichthys crocea]|uniref:Zinc finger protein Rlf Rearranged L-myc fusion gene protein Zn-15-related protein n=1 Tax=Larimichthys crocea TaxID=215358 RepID=A0A6G0IFA7_LARCR|nr:Zinc finger protein Rlf Rearranged L-myc fusion gene protein Zn-15-related protein [Larimichthys crocea]